MSSITSLLGQGSTCVFPVYGPLQKGFHSPRGLPQQEHSSQFAFEQVGVIIPFVIWRLSIVNVFNFENAIRL